jgi:hypothetical protein
VRSGDLVLNTRFDQPHRSVRPGGVSEAQIPVSAGPGLHLDECRSLSPTSLFGVLVSAAAGRVGVDPRALAVRALLHLPRIATSNGWATKWQVERELTISAERLHRDVRAAGSHLPVDNFPLRDLAFEEIDPSRALPVLTSLHYLRSVRPSSIYFGLIDPVSKLPVNICSISPLQWKCVARWIDAESALRPEQVWDVSRMYSVAGAPPNAISTLLSKVRTVIRRNISSAALLVTAVDPNLGFTGSSYRAANWQHWMNVKARPYLYESGRYVSPRQLRERFGRCSFIELQAKHPGRFQQSKVRLLDSMIFCCSVNGETTVVPAQDRRRLNR